MIRFVLDPAGQVVPDVDGRLPGRGMWLSAERNVLNKAVGANVFARAARPPARVEVNLAEQSNACLRVRRWTVWGWRGGPARWPWVSSRCACACAQRQQQCWSQPPTVRKMVGAKLRRLAPDRPTIAAFSKAELSAALGREGVVHVAVAPGALPSVCCTLHPAPRRISRERLGTALERQD